MEFNGIRSFLLVAEEGNLTRAAARRHTTPSAVSAHLKQLEDRLGVILFERSPRGMILTLAGQQLVGPARRVMAARRELMDAAAALRGVSARTMRLGLNAPPEHLRIGDLIRLVAHDDPPLVVQLVSSMSERILEDLLHERLDAGFIYGPVNSPGLVRRQLAMRRLRVAVPGDMDLDLLPDSPAARAALPWIWPGVAGCPFRLVMADILGPAEADANIVTRIDGEESIRALVRAGMGVGLLEERYGQEAAGDGRLKLLDPFWEIELGLAFRRDRTEDPAIAALVRGIDAVWSGTRGAGTESAAGRSSGVAVTALEHRVPGPGGAVPARGNAPDGSPGQRPAENAGEVPDPGIQP